MLLPVASANMLSSHPASVSEDLMYSWQCFGAPKDAQAPELLFILHIFCVVNFSYMLHASAHGYFLGLQEASVA